MRTLLVFLILVPIRLMTAAAEPVVIGHPGMKPIDPTTLRRVYTGKVVEVNGVRVTPLNLPSGNPLRDAFLRAYLDQDDAKYIGYWTVRRYVGKGTPPKELTGTQDVIRYVTKTSGAIGYVDDNDLAPDLNVLSKHGR